MLIEKIKTKINLQDTIYFNRKQKNLNDKGIDQLYSYQKPFTASNYMI